jgi:hypothetical protein
MRTERWLSVILFMGLFMALSVPSAQAGPHRPFAPQTNRQAFARPQPRAFANGCNSQPRQWAQPRGNAYGWHGQNRQWRQPRGNAYGWHGQPHPGRQPHGIAYERNDHQRRWNQPRNDYGWNGHQRQGQQPHPSFAQGDRGENWQFQPSNGGQHYNPGSPYHRAGYQVPPQSPNSAPGSSVSSHNTTIPGGRTGGQPGFHQNSGNAPLVRGNSPEGVIKAADYQDSQGWSRRN